MSFTPVLSASKDIESREDENYPRGDTAGTVTPALGQIEAAQVATVLQAHAAWPTAHISKEDIGLAWVEDFEESKVGGAVAKV